MNAERMPVLIGAGQRTVRDEPLGAVSTPLDLMQGAALDAAADAGLDAGVLAGLDELAVVKSFREPTRNTPALLAGRLGASRCASWLVPDGGQGPQQLVNHYAERIARGQARCVLIAGGEALDNGRRLVKAGIRPDWSEPVTADAKYLFADAPMGTGHERAHGIWRANHVYPLFENALRGHYGLGLDAYQHVMGELFAPFTEVAAQVPTAWFPVARSAADIATPGPRNRYVAYPHTKFMNAMNQVNQSAAVLLCSLAQARALGVEPARMVYLHGCADTLEHGFVSGRVDYHSAPAARVLGEQALAMAGCEIDDLEFIDIYSCFPCAVQMVRDALGIARDDGRALTVTGGLPYHGGAGNSYSLNAIATLIARLRERPGSRGLVTANGGYLSKHSAGIYSTRPPTGEWRRVPPSSYQAAIDALTAPALAESPAGAGIIETYTVTFGRDGEPERGIVIGRLGTAPAPLAPRFLANLPDDRELLASVTREDFLGLRGSVRAGGEVNLFTPA